MPREILDLTKSLTRGINVKPENSLFADYLASAQDVKVCPFGLGYYDFTRSGYTVFGTWPNPQTLVSLNEIFALGTTTVFTANPSTWALTSASVVDTSGNPASPTAGGVWHTAMIGDLWVACNGNSMLISGADIITTDNAPNTVGTLKGRLLAGGMASFISSASADNINSLRVSHGDYSSFSLEENMLYYASADIMDFFHLLFGTFNKELLTQYFQNNEAGYLPMNWKGKIHCIKELGDGAVVYGESGIAFVKFEESPIALSRVDLASYGIAERGAVAGDIFEHCFIDENLKIRKITPDLKISEPLYDDYTTGFTDSIVGTFDPIERNYFFCDDVFGLVLSDSGLSLVTASYSSMFVHGGSLIKIASASASGVQKFTTGFFDMGSRDHKLVVGVRLGTTVESRVRLRYRDSSLVSISTSSWVTIDATGYAEFMISAIEFQIEVERTGSGTPSYTSLFVEYERNGKLGLSGRL